MTHKKDSIDTGWHSLVDERRGSHRFDLRLPVTLRHNGKLIPATTENVSCGGMCLSTSTSEITMGGNVEVILDLTEMERDVTLRGTILRMDNTTKKQMAIQFVNLLSGGHTSLQRFLKKIEK